MTVLVNHWRAFSRVLAIALLLGLPGGVWMYDNLFDWRDYFADQGVDGPFEAIPLGSDVAGNLLFGAGDRLSAVAPGQRFAWVSRVCLNQDTMMIARASIREISANGRVWEGTPVLFTPKSERCGPLVGSRIVATDAAPGSYEVEREVILRPGRILPLHRKLSGLVFRVAKPD